ncbi:hypothetical protein SK128_020588 [Halocaridina rubra]|uniref:Uncharacterized protein n=1 Tax=Halocaridina rubra TaxID=373956 RepID=A0AAN9ACQ1_HALRR
MDPCMDIMSPPPAPFDVPLENHSSSGDSNAEEPPSGTSSATVEGILSREAPGDKAESLTCPLSDCDSDVDLMKVMKKKDEPPMPLGGSDGEEFDEEGTDEDEEDFMVHFAHTGRKTFALHKLACAVYGVISGTAQAPCSVWGTFWNCAVSAHAVC